MLLYIYINIKKIYYIKLYWFKKFLVMREIIDKVRFFIDKIKYGRGKNFYITVVVLLILIITVFSVIYINLQIEIKRKENILKSYYSGDNTASIEPEGAAGGENGEVAGSEGSNKNLPAGNGNYFESIDNDGDYNLQQPEVTIKVYICGEVENSGVYELKQGSRIIDLIEVAGGQGENACLEIINLARILVDGQRVYIPSMEEVANGNSLFFTGNYSDDYNAAENLNININTANLNELESLPGIGPVIAGNIIKYRERNGLFEKKEELKKVTGIGEKKYEEIIEFISI